MIKQIISCCGGQIAKQTRQPMAVDDIPADYIVSVLAHHKERICEAKQEPRKSQRI